MNNSTAMTGTTEPSRAALLDDYRAMLRIRRFEEACAESYSAGQIRGFLHLGIGEEAIAVGALAALTPEDAVVATYREHGHALARGIPMGAILAEMYGKANGCCRGRGGSMHLFDAERRFFGGHAIVGGGLPVAVGLALADQLQGHHRVTACFFGDGAVAEGEFHESMNLAALWRLPVLFLCENNRYAMGTALTRHQAQPDLAEKARSYGMPAATVDGMRLSEVRSVTRDAAAEVRAGHGPRFLEYQTYRFRAHSMYDPELYRTREEVEAWKARCPLRLYGEEIGLTADERQTIEDEVAAEIKAALLFAEAGPLEPVEHLLRDVVGVHP
jgi:pyruvate dehydrogenase E1 component alpha subunit